MSKLALFDTFLNIYAVAQAPESAVRLLDYVMGDEPTDDIPAGTALTAALLQGRFDQLVRICFPLSRADVKSELNLIIGKPDTILDLIRAAKSLETICSNLPVPRKFQEQELLGFYRYATGPLRAPGGPPTCDAIANDPQTCLQVVRFDTKHMLASYQWDKWILGTQRALYERLIKPRPPAQPA